MIAFGHCSVKVAGNSNRQVLSVIISERIIVRFGVWKASFYEGLIFSPILYRYAGEVRLMMEVSCKVYLQFKLYSLLSAFVNFFAMVKLYGIGIK